MPILIAPTHKEMARLSGLEIQVVTSPMGNNRASHSLTLLTWPTQLPLHQNSKKGHLQRIHIYTPLPITSTTFQKIQFQFLQFSTVL